MSGNQPEDVMGNPILKETLVTVQSPFIIIWRVVAVDNGSETTPARVRLAADITLHSLPGTPFMNIVRVATPPDEQLLERFMGVTRQ